MTLTGLDNGQTLLGGDEKKRVFAGTLTRADDQILLHVHAGADGGKTTLRVQRK